MHGILVPCIRRLIITNEFLCTTHVGSSISFGAVSLPVACNYSSIKGSVAGIAASLSARFLRSNLNNSVMWMTLMMKRAAAKRRFFSLPRAIFAQKHANATEPFLRFVYLYIFITRCIPHTVFILVVRLTRSFLSIGSYYISFCRIIRRY